MAEFIIGNSLRKQARKHKYLRQLLWGLDFAAAWLVFNISKLLPVDTSSRLGDRVGRWVGPRLAEKTAIYRDNFAKAFPQLNETGLDQLVTRAWGRAGRILTEYPHLESIRKDPRRLQIDVREPIETYSNPKAPCVIVTAHLSNWEVVCSAMAKMDIPNASLYSPPTNPLLDRMLLKSRRALNCQLLPRDNSARLLMRALKEGRTAAMVMDRRVDDGKPIQFFGLAKSSTIMPARLALKFQCELVPVQVERLRDAHFRVTFHKPVRPADTSATQIAQAIDMTQQVHDQFEQWIRSEPRDWFCSKRLWARGKIDSLKEGGRDADIDSYAA